MNKLEKNQLEDDTKDSVSHLVQHRLPWLILGLLGGILTSVLVGNFEKLLASDIRLVFFMPILVYMSDAIGTQTETIYVRHLKKSGMHFWRHIFKETLLGLSLGGIFGLVIGIFAYFWLHSSQVAITVGLAMFINVTIAPVLAILIPAAIYRKHWDPALGTGPMATVIQDFISIMIYFGIASFLVF